MQKLNLNDHTTADESEARDLVVIRDFISRYPNPFDRRLVEGHLTGSALVLHPSGERVVLLHHRKLGLWLQPGGHGEPGEMEGTGIALREACEETGIVGLTLHPTAPRPLDIDVHEIPARGTEPAHLHLDLRYLVLTPIDAEPRTAEAEAHAVRWFGWSELAALDLDPGLQRALRKARAWLRTSAPEAHRNG